ncbi:putative monooxygenase [Massarina eburnea CBS 473.64]|uniref:Putative monooxygenase n=1 Tax=Massarina eburnea CBS 473.64 TaxID=1395130 RepID=A0A6A6SG49_9PLEO|nr:putative monooxygenase [Massarina eburnea CBS 473.64]
MSKTDNSFRVLIAGGGVAGLTLAIMLEKFDIDYILLEGHDDIAPAVGASIAMFPNGTRILDQLDCYEPLLDLADLPTLNGASSMRDVTGKEIGGVAGVHKHLERRHGYPLMFFDRQWLLRVLHDRLEDKSKIHLSQKVDHVSLAEGGVQVTTKSGQKFSGSILVGADGVHSTVRQEMQRVAAQLAPSYFDPGENDRVPAYYLCSFGIAQHVPGWMDGDQVTVLGNGGCQLAIAGPQKRVYWFFFSRLPETKYGKDIPRCTKEMEREFVEKRYNMPITEKVTFGQLYAKRLSSTLTPLHEYVYKKWFFNRIITFGDSAHKPDPISGQGGNNAIESSAELVNVLLRKRDSRANGLSNLSDQEVEAIFAEMQTARHTRAERIVWAAHFQQSLLAFERPLLSSFYWNFLSNLKGNEGTLGLLALNMIRAKRLDALPLKKRPRAVPFLDELPAPPLKSPLLVQILFAGAMAYLVRVAFTTLPRRSFGFNFTNGAVSPPLFDGNDAGKMLHSLYSASQLLSPILISILEGYRNGNKGTPLALSILFLVAMQYYGIGTSASVYTLLNSFLTFDSAMGRFVSLEVAHTLVPAVAVGYLVPTMLMNMFVQDRPSFEKWAALWQLTPVLVSIVVYIISSALRSWNQKGMTQDEKLDAELEQYKDLDVPVLKSTYIQVFGVQAISYLGTLVYALRDPSVSLAKVYFGLSGSRLDTRALLESDMAVAVAAWLLAHLYMIWNLRRLGYIKTRDAFAPTLGAIVGQVLVGPGATWAGLWYWREQALASLNVQAPAYLSK